MTPIYFFQGFAFRFNIGTRIDIGCIQVCVAKPTANDRDIDSRRDKMNRSRMPTMYPET